MRKARSFYSGMRLLMGVLYICMSGSPASAQGDEEVVLTFNHPSIGQYYISSVFHNNTVYLPATEIFNLIYVPYEKGASGKSLKGTWQTEDNAWTINTNLLQASMGKDVIPLTASDFRFGELDLFLSPEIFERLFGLKFTININALSVSLQSDKPLPVEEKKAHEQLRAELERRKAGDSGYQLKYDRSRKIIGGGFTDYNVSLNNDNLGTYGIYTISGGAELLGGDIQGTLYGTAGGSSAFSSISNLIWRYAPVDNPWLTSVRAGQISTTGLLPQRIIGGAISNDPIEPRRSYNSYTIDGTTVPDSEVELYLNNQLTDYVRADELGYYRFTFGLTYGTVRINLRIYTPTGQIITEERQMQIPYTFLPKGIVSYNVQGGLTDKSGTDIGTDNYGIHGDIAYGLTNTITLQAGTDYVSTNSRPINYGSLSARLFDQYLVSIDAAPRLYYRASGSVTYASGRSIAVNYTRYDNDSLYNPRRSLSQLDGSLYMPFTVLGLRSGLRLGGEHFLYKSSAITNYNLDLNTTVGRFNIRANYRDQLLRTGETYNPGLGLVTGSLTYTFSRTPGVPVFVKGMFLRAQTRYDVHNKNMFDAGLQLSRTFFRNARLNINLNHYFATGISMVQAGFTIDMRHIRSNTQFATSNSGYNIQQTFSGSVGYDSENRRLQFSNREHVGRTAIAVLFFIDNNNNGTYEKGEEKVQTSAIRLNEPSIIEIGKDSVLRITQLQNYWKYNAEIAVTSLPDPSLAPAFTRFSFIADPNRYKPVEIPLYRTGVIDGNVRIRKEKADEGIGGLRIILRNAGTKSEETIRTFADGGFYAMNLLPGHYTLEADPAQLSFLNVKSIPGKLEFEIKAVADGDYVEGLNMLLAHFTDSSMIQADKKADDDSSSFVNPRSIETISETSTLVRSQDKPDVNMADTKDFPGVINPVQESGKDTVYRIIHRVTRELQTITEDEYHIQAGAFRTRENAVKMLQAVMEKTGRKAEIISEDNFYKVRIRGLKNEEEAESVINTLQDNGYPDLWLITVKAGRKEWIETGRQDTVFQVLRKFSSEPLPSEARQMVVQAGAFRYEKNAISVAAKLSQITGKPVRIVYEDGLNKVRIPGFGSAGEMEKMIEDLRKLNFNYLWIPTLKINPSMLIQSVVSMNTPSGGTMPGIRKKGTDQKQNEEVGTTALRIGEFRTEKEAMKAQEKIESKLGVKAGIVKIWENYYVVIRGFKTREETYTYYPLLTGLGYPRIHMIIGN